MLDITHKTLRSQPGWTKRRVCKGFMEMERKLIRQPPAWNGHKKLPCLQLANRKIRRASVAWYCGLFPRRAPDKSTVDAKQKEDAIKTLNGNMSKKKWSDKEKTNTFAVL